MSTSEHSLNTSTCFNRDNHLVVNSPGGVIRGSRFNKIYRRDYGLIFHCHVTVIVPRDLFAVAWITSEPCSGVMRSITYQSRRPVGLLHMEKFDQCPPQHPSDMRCHTGDVTPFAYFASPSHSLSFSVKPKLYVPVCPYFVTFTSVTHDPTSIHVSSVTFTPHVMRKYHYRLTTTRKKKPNKQTNK